MIKPPESIWKQLNFLDEENIDSGEKPHKISF